MAGGVMTTGRDNGRAWMRSSKKLYPLDGGRKTIRLRPDAADLMRHVLVTAGSLGAEAPPISR